MQGFDRYKVFSAADELRAFTVRDLAARAVVSESHVQKIIQRSSGLFKPIGTITQGRGRPATRYRIHPDRFDQLRRDLHAHREELRQVIGVHLPEPEPAEDSALLALRVAEFELSHRFPEAQDTLEQASVLERARDLLNAVRKSRLQAPDVESRQRKADDHLKELSATVFKRKKAKSTSVVKEVTAHAVEATASIGE